MTDNPTDAPPRGPPAPPIARNARGYRQTHAYGNPIKGTPRPTSVTALVDQKNYWRRAARGLIGVSKELAHAADFAGSVKMNQPEEAVRRARALTFGHHFSGSPLCEIERDLARGMNAVVLLVAYTGCKTAIERQLMAMPRTPQTAVPPVTLSDAEVAALLRFEAFERGKLGAEAFAQGVAVYCRLAFGPNDPRAHAFKEAMAKQAVEIVERERSGEVGDIAAQPPRGLSTADSRQVREAFVSGLPAKP